MEIIKLGIDFQLHWNENDFVVAVMTLIFHLRDSLQQVILGLELRTGAIFSHEPKAISNNSKLAVFSEPVT